MSSLKITYVSLARLKPDPGNARLHTPRQIQKIATSIQKFGFNNPILVDADANILAGHGRYRAAEKLGMPEVPVVRLDHLSPAEKRAFMLADNRTAEDARWDPDLLATELQNLILIDADFEITDTGFEMAEIDALLLPANDHEDEPDPADASIDPDAVPHVARPGDLWMVGDHRVFCGDALDPASYVALQVRLRLRSSATMATHG